MGIRRLKEVAMKTFKRFRKGLLLGALTLAMSLFVPVGTSHAAPSADAHNRIRSIFNRVGLKYEAPKAKLETPSKEEVNPARAPRQEEPKEEQQPNESGQARASSQEDR